MSRLVVLGTAAAVADAVHENTYLVLDCPHGSILIDCAGNPIGRLQHAGVPVHTLHSVIITHIHPDHAYGLPILLMSLWLLGRSVPLTVYAPPMAVPRLKTIMDAYDWADWPAFFGVDFKPIELTANALVLDNEDVTISAAPGDHFVESLSLRITAKATGKTLVYTSDTAPTPQLKVLARGVDVLVHEAAGATQGHSSAAMAGVLAREAAVRKLVLVHYPVYADQAALLNDARLEFTGPIDVAQDFAEYFF